jgi:pimeloyl-ACP methyl ester carboxylesterase
MTTPRLHKKTLAAKGNVDFAIHWLHGWGQTGASLEALAGLFTGFGQNTLYDLPGFGKTAQLKNDAGTEDYAEYMSQNLLGNSKKKVILAGHSFGCRVSLRMAARHPANIAGLILIAAPGVPRKRSPGFHIRRLSLKILGFKCALLDKVFKTQFKTRFRSRFGSRDYKNAGPLRTTLVKTVNEDLSAIAQKVQCPVLLIYGDRDSETPPVLGETFSRLIGKSDLFILEGYGHLDILTEGRYQCQQKIEQFLRGL